ncbi:Dihydropteroate synthase [Candidatus Ruthia magnifica str. Cm (Calyptogena magnifica)]|uniref:Dihydropteroate synthase n=1 Tax=Ruthia magnifica subsp. Calyptogena magnifica TaxID=413404 RepID=A1AVH4_RUTMC|nr:dihydropteroate synthase [Candidatus Ruthturnera calyptogenae]ABL01931.1 Dihydropteroate synthase [Candidatus Ruthia magnifica str. Cm (Calyptogena magnifica)]
MQSTNAMIMGVLNITPDSFSDGGQYLAIDKAINQAQLMIEQGADMIDIGGESSRPNAPKVSTDDEASRVIPVIKVLSKLISVPISIDTAKAKIMQLAIEAGASMINDVRALQAKSSLEVAASTGKDVCLMHMQGNSKTMQNNPVYINVIDEIKYFFDQRVEACINAGINQNKIILDPGFGFGKTFNHNLEILRSLDEFKSFGLRILVGMSRKSMVGSMLNSRNINGRVIGSVTTAIIASQNGADIVRVHDVLETKDAFKVLQSVAG